MTSNAPPKIKQFSLSKLGGLLLLLSLTSFILEAPLKYLLIKLHASPALYLRDVYAVLVIFISLLSWIAGKSFSPSVIVVPILFAHMLYGIAIIGSLAQPIIALKTYLFFVLGTTSFETFKNNIETVKKWMVWMFALTVLGIFINRFIDMPWKDEVFESATGDVQVSKEWVAAGVSRVAGFARASYDASTYAAILGASIALIPGIGSITRLIVLASAMTVVVMTTSKGSILALALMVVFIYQSKENEKNKAPFWLYISPLLLLTIPVFLYIYEFRLEINSALWIYLSSFAERINWMWPRAFNLMQSPWTILFGRGLGGIGFAQRFGEASQYNSADNTMVYFFVTFGLASIFYVYTIIKNLANRADGIPSYIWNCLLLWLIYWLAYGFTGNAIENGPLAFCLGIVTGASMSAHITQIKAIHA